MIVITPSLCAGTPEEAEGKWGGIYAKTASDAVHAIREGAVAFIPRDGWEGIARTILANWCESADVDEVIHFALTGRVRLAKD
jgi:hypothetical protein